MRVASMPERLVLIAAMAGAATRVAFYFPQETAAMLAARLGGLDVSPVPKGTDENDWTPHRIRAKANGIDPAAVVEALSWSTRPEITRAIAAIGLRADDASVLHASISPATREIAGEAMFERLATLVEEATPTNYGSGDHFRVDTIGTLVRNWPQRAQAPIERFLAPGGIPRMQAVASGLGGAEELPEWSKPLLTRWLEDTTVVREANASEPGSPELPFCDLVAETIARRLGVPFHWTETRKRRDAARGRSSRHDRADRRGQDPCAHGAAFARSRDRRAARGVAREGSPARPGPMAIATPRPCSGSP